jgi:hypothetical protein
LSRTVQGFFPKTTSDAPPPDDSIKPIDHSFFAKSPVELSQFSEIPTSDELVIAGVSEVNAENIDVVEDVVLSVEPPSFMQAKNHAQPEARYRHVWLGLSVLLGVIFFLQLLVSERDRLAATAPGLKPLLVSLCSALDCKIAPLQHIESIVIDSSSFVKFNTDVSRLNFTFKNTNPMELMLPSLELTLTDIHDQPVIRRIIDAGDLGAKTDTIASGAELSTTLPLGIKIPNGAERIAGYRLLAFYP